MKQRLKTFLDTYSLTIDQMIELETILKEIEVIQGILHDNHANSEGEYIPSLALVQSILKTGY